MAPPDSYDEVVAFLAAGPAFRQGVVLPALDNVDVYPLLMRLIDVAPLPSDGEIAPLLPALVQSGSTAPARSSRRLVAV